MQVFYREDAGRLIPDGCIAIGNEHGACMDRGCEYCLIYYYGPEEYERVEEEKGEAYQTLRTWQS